MLGLCSLELLVDPLLNQLCVVDADPVRNTSKLLQVLRGQIDLNRCLICSLENGLGDFFQFILKICHIMLIPEASKFFN